MIRKHVDLIAIGVLLGGLALYSGARHATALAVVSHRRVIVSPHFHPPVIVIPKVPHIPYSRD